MNITKIISPPNCANGACPSIILADNGTVLIQGAKLGHKRPESLKVPNHEDVVGIPREVFDALISQYRQ